MKYIFVIWDAENVAYKRLEMREFASKVRDKYGYYNARYLVVGKKTSPQDLKIVGEAGFDVVYVPPNGDTDQRIYDRVTDEIRHNSSLEKVVLISGDKDFVRLGKICKGQGIKFDVISKDDVSLANKLQQVADLCISATSLW